MRDFNHPFCHKAQQVHPPQGILTEMATFQNGTVAFAFTPNLIEIHQNNSTVILNMNVKLIFYVITNRE